MKKFLLSLGLLAGLATATDTAGVRSHSTSSSATTIEGNCFEEVTPAEIVNNSGATVSGNDIDPVGGCQVPDGVPMM